MFSPLFEVTLYPEKYPELYLFLRRVIGFDSVDDESKSELYSNRHNFQSPSDWIRKDNPPYIYWLYYMYANMVSLNHIRKSRSMSKNIHLPV